MSVSIEFLHHLHLLLPFFLIWLHQLFRFLFRFNSLSLQFLPPPLFFLFLLPMFLCLSQYQISKFLLFPFGLFPLSLHLLCLSSLFSLQSFQPFKILLKEIDFFLSLTYLSTFLYCLSLRYQHFTLLSYHTWRDIIFSQWGGHLVWFG
jgi:hypothetical protein